MFAADLTLKDNCSVAAAISHESQTQLREVRNKKWYINMNWRLDMRDRTTTVKCTELTAYCSTIVLINNHSKLSSTWK